MNFQASKDVVTRAESTRKAQCCLQDSASRAFSEELFPLVSGIVRLFCSGTFSPALHVRTTDFASAPLMEDNADGLTLPTFAGKLGQDWDLHESK